MAYSMAGIFRRTPSGTYFYRHPCVMNKWCFFYTAFGLILYTPQLAAAARNKYGVRVGNRSYCVRASLLFALRFQSFVMWERCVN